MDAQELLAQLTARERAASRDRNLAQNETARQLMAAREPGYSWPAARVVRRLATGLLSLRRVRRGPVPEPEILAVPLSK